MHDFESILSGCCVVLGECTYKGRLIGSLSLGTDIDAYKLEGSQPHLGACSLTCLRLCLIDLTRTTGNCKRMIMSGGGRCDFSDRDT